ncbi:MAG TPA: hypothetical protein DDZ80_17930 [Cyanobacteria bacterium UBA8803]|nr:hypothetical protein [Cyanobacteria bacterium UBA9273]HBL60265.1 hypothetical protein [Cyanobacteria bacterium UBA8803]
MRIYSFVWLATVLVTSLTVNYSFPEGDQSLSFQPQLLASAHYQPKNKTSCRGDDCRGNGRREILT